LKICFLTTVYPKSLAKHKDYISNFNVQEIITILLKDSASFLSFWTKYLDRINIDTKIISADLLSLFFDKKNLHKKNNLITEIMNYNPDFIFVFSPHYYRNIIKEIKDHVSNNTKIVAWYGANQGDEKKVFSNYDLVLSNSKILRNRLLELGMNSEILYHSFESSIYKEIHDKHKVKHRKNSLVFTGTLGLQNPDHTERYNYLEKLSAMIPVDLFSDDIPYRKTKKQLLIETRQKVSKNLSKTFGNHTPVRLKSWADKSKQPHFPPTTPNHIVRHLSKAVYGRDMLEKMFEYTICFNNHNRVTGDSACNMRLFEATGMGCCLLTDHKSDIHSIFEPDKEVVTYKTPSEAIDKAKYLLNNPKTAQEIAKAGQQKTFLEHTTDKQVDHLLYYLKNLWN
jgi:spore maturation protein CgeB